MISMIKLNGLLHSDNNCALKEITRQLCLEHQLQFSKMASFDENSQFLLSILRECGLAHKTIIFMLDEFDLFTQEVVVSSSFSRRFSENFKSTLPCILRQPKLEALKDCSILELYVLVCMKRLEVKELELCNFNSVMKEYESIHNTFQTSDRYARNICLWAFEHLLERALISFEDNRGHVQSPEVRPVKLLISWHELHQGLKSHHSCSVVLHKVMDRQG
ncbi:hypothetical protein ACS0TY_023748 [Phlomoides rotata]